MYKVFYNKNRTEKLSDITVNYLRTTMFLTLYRQATCVLIGNICSNITRPTSLHSKPNETAVSKVATLFQTGFSTTFP